MVNQRFRAALVSIVVFLALGACSSNRTPTNSSGASQLPSPAPVLASAFLAGNATFALAPGSAGVVVIGQSPADSSGGGTNVAIVVRNNTAKAVADIQVTATARDHDGKAIASGSSQGFVPIIVKPGYIALGYVFFQLAQLPKDIDLKLDVASSPPGGEDAIGPLDLRVSEANHVSQRIVGIVANTLDRAVEGPISVVITCFDATGKILGGRLTYAEKDRLPAKATSPFQVDLFDDPCPAYLVGASGNSF